MGRLRTNPQAISLISHSKVFISNPDQKQSLWNQIIFKNTYPIYLEIGMGKGKFIIEQALKNPQINFIGIEKYPTVILKAINKYDNLELPPDNLRFICYDAKNLQLIFLENEITKIFLNFSDPWPKARHTKRRLTHSKFLETYLKILKSQGQIEIKTDNLSLYNYTLEELSHKKDLKILYTTKNLYADINMTVNHDNIITEYETKFISENKPIYKILLLNMKKMSL